MRYGIRCGVGSSLRVLTEKPAFARLLTEKGPEPIIRGVASAIVVLDGARLPLDISKACFFVFGGFTRTVDWINTQCTPQLSNIVRRHTARAE